MRKHYKYHKSYAEKMLFCSYVEKISLDICLQKVGTHILELTI